MHLLCVKIMEYLASTAVHFSVWSSDPNLVSTNVTVRAHSKCPVNRLTQYIHYMLKQQHTAGIPEPGELKVIYRNEVLSGDTICRQIETNYHGAIRLQVERKPATDDITDLSYDPATFLNTGVQIEVNVLSIEKVHKALLRDISPNSTILHLAKAALKELNKYERSNPLNICSVRDHKLEDIAGLDIAGRSHVIYLSESTIDLTLSDLLGIDFAPYDNGYCSLLCKVKHGQMVDDGVTVEFVSDAKFTIDRMVVTADTTILDVKNFICSVYAHTLRLTPHDIKLIYKGCILHERNGATNEDNKILKFITEHVGAKLHVHINHNYSEPGPGFWNELLFAPDRFAFMSGANGTQVESVPASGNDIDNDFMTNQVTASSVSTPFTPPLVTSFEANGVATNSSGFESQTATSIISRRSLKTTTGENIIRSYETFEKVIINGETIFLPLHQLDHEYYEITIGNETLNFSLNEVQISNNHLTFTSVARQAIENKIGENIKITNPSILPTSGDEQLLDANNDSITETNVQPTSILDPRRVFRFNYREFFTREIVGRIFGAILSHFLIWALLLVQLYEILPLPIFLFLTLALVSRLIWINFKIGALIRRKLIGSENCLSEIEITQINADIKERHYDTQFFQIIANSKEAGTMLCEQLQKNEVLLAALKAEVSAYKDVKDICTNQDDFVLTNEFLVQKYIQHMDNSGLPLTYSLYEEILDQMSPMLGQEISSLPSWSRNAIHGIRKLNLVRNRSKFSRVDYIKIWFDIYRPWEYVSDTTIMRYIVPNPRTDRLLVGFVKNFVLFFVLFFPGFERQFDQIIEERFIEQSQEENSVA